MQFDTGSRNPLLVTTLGQVVEIHCCCCRFTSFRRIYLRRYTNPGIAERISYMWSATPQQGIRLSRLCANERYRFLSRGETQVLPHFPHRRLPRGSLQYGQDFLSRRQLQRKVSPQHATKVVSSLCRNSLQEKHLAYIAANLQLHADRREL